MRRLLTPLLIAVVLIGGPLAARAQSQAFAATCIYPTALALFDPTFLPKCDASGYLDVDVKTGTVTATTTFPYNMTNGQTIQTLSAVGIVALDAAGHASPVQEDATFNVLTNLNAGFGTNTTNPLDMRIQGGGTTNLTAVNPPGTSPNQLLGIQPATLGVPFYTGGSSTTAIAAASAGPNMIKNSAGRLINAVITAAGTTGTDTFYDNASACSGTVIGIIPGATSVATAVTGTQYPIFMPAANGITECGGTGSAAVTAGWM